jgi:hypothetical protein
MRRTRQSFQLDEICTTALSFQLEEMCTTILSFQLEEMQYALLYVPVLSTTETFVFPVDPNQSRGWNPGFLQPNHSREKVPCYTTAAES